MKLRFSFLLLFLFAFLLFLALAAGASRSTLLFLSGLVLLAGGAGFYLLRSKSSAVESLSAAVEKLKAGDYSARPSIPAADELAPVARAVNELAEELQKKDFCVLAFDFRGHGDSTTVEPDKFWTTPYNKSLVKSKNKTAIDYKNFDKRYYPALVNDIAAAKAFLDRSKNDSGICNTSSTIVIGGETGATLGAIWINSEWNRFKIEITPFLEVRASDRPEGQYLSGFVALSMPPRIGTRSVHLARTLDLASRQNAMPTVFVHGDGDPKEDFNIG